MLANKDKIFETGEMHQVNFLVTEEDIRKDGRIPSI